jgi:hypothetical protein
MKELTKALFQLRPRRLHVLDKVRNRLLSSVIFLFLLTLFQNYIVLMHHG